MVGSKHYCLTAVPICDALHMVIKVSNISLTDMLT